MTLAEKRAEAASADVEAGATLSLANEETVQAGEDVEGSFTFGKVKSASPEAAAEDVSVGLTLQLPPEFAEAPEPEMGLLEGSVGTITVKLAKVIG